ncbi:MAG: gas vesicle protein GvpG [Planctomycetes bacterium]|nr:gas vesicle protein GvpG [Planctomycetota bacterium]
MFLLDDILLAPARGFLSVVREIHGMADSELHDTRPAVQDLQELYMRLETGQITEEEFARREAEILARLDLAGRDGGPPGEAAA